MAAGIEKEGKDQDRETTEQEYIEDVSPSIAEENGLEEGMLHIDHIYESPRGVSEGRGQEEIVNAGKGEGSGTSSRSE